MSAILFGSISTLADTSELQRKAFNDAFTQHHLDWNWSREDYQALMGTNGGAQRIADFAQKQGQDVDAAAVHATKSALFQQSVVDSSVEPRPGVVETIAAAKENGLRVGFVTTTSKENITAVLTALAPHVTAESFDVIVDGSSVDSGKPDPASYTYALGELGESAQDCVAIEDNEGGVRAAAAADVTVIAFPNQNTAGGDFAAATEKVESLDPQRVRQLATATN